jgi:hypothetical protein
MYIVIVRCRHASRRRKRIGRLEALSVLLRLSGPEQQLQQRINHVRAIIDESEQ